MSILENLLALTNQRHKTQPKRKRRWRSKYDLRGRKTAHWLKIKARRPARPLPPPFGNRIIDRIALVMEPGKWYGRDDLRRAVGRSQDGRWKVREMFVAGLLARAQNPAWRGTVNPWEAMAGLAEPKWLYRLTPMGEALRAAVSLLQ